MTYEEFEKLEVGQCVRYEWGVGSYHILIITDIRYNISANTKEISLHILMSSEDSFFPGRYWANLCGSPGAQLTIGALELVS